MKKLIPAICMLFIAASMFGTSTFAWFSMNSVVTATGMKVTAKSATNLLISGDGLSFSQDIDLSSTSGATELLPASAVAVRNVKGQNYAADVQYYTYNSTSKKYEESTKLTTGDSLIGTAISTDLFVVDYDPTFYGIKNDDQGDIPSAIYKMEKAKEGAAITGMNYYALSTDKKSFVKLSTPAPVVDNTYVCLKAATGNYAAGVAYFQKNTSTGVYTVYDASAKIGNAVEANIYVNDTKMKLLTSGTFDNTTKYYRYYNGQYVLMTLITTGDSGILTYKKDESIGADVYVADDTVEPIVIDSKNTVFNADDATVYDFFKLETSTGVYTMYTDAEVAKWFDGKKFKMSADSKDYAVDTVFSDVTGNASFVYSHALYLKSTQDITENIKVTVTADEEEHRALDTSLRLMMVFLGTGAEGAALENTKETIVFAPVTDSAACAPVASLDTNGEPVLGATEVLNKTGSQVVFTKDGSTPSLAKNTVYKVMVYIYFEGEASECKSIYTADLVDTLFTITFEVEPIV